MERRPKVLRDFLAAWFETVAWMKANRAKAIEISNKVIKLPADVAEKTYDRVMPTYSTDGRFTRAGFQKLVESTAELNVASAGETTDFSKLYTEEFLPTK
jgi:ABC-type nitrate/sulfonate/bicarbonate transport system substrate-binding protein